MNQKNETQWKTTACILCECNCGIEVQLGGEKQRQFLRFRGDRKHPASQGYACEKPHRLNYYQNHRGRITQPLRRLANGEFEPISWELAIAEIAARFTRIRDSFGGESIFYYGGGGQGNHLPGTYAAATRRALGSRYRSSALAQEKTGEFWVSERMLGAYTRADFEHCDVALFLGKNPWYSHSIPQARVTLKKIAKDPDRKMIVVDPRRTKTAQMADLHLQVKPGGDAWLLAALLAVICGEGWQDDPFISAHTIGFGPVKAALKDLSVAQYCDYAGVPETQVRQAAHMIANAKRLASFEDLGVQMNRHSTLVSYLHRLLWCLTGNFAKSGTHFIPTPLLPIAGGSHKRNSPVAGAKIIGGLVPCNVIAEEILTEHPKRYRAMLVESANPAHSLADSKHIRKALKALDTLVVIDIALTETAQLADYVLPATTQYEKAEATFFNLEFPRNVFHLRAPIMAPPEGPLPEAEIHSRLVEAITGLDPQIMAGLKAAASKGMQFYGAAFMKLMGSRADMAGLAPVILYRSLGPFLPKGMAQGAVLLALAFNFARKYPQSLARAGFSGTPPEAAGKLFAAILNNPSGVVFCEDTWEDIWDRVATPESKIQLALSDLLQDLTGLAAGPAAKDPAFPLVLSAGERRAFTANTIIRDPRWRKKDESGALRIHPEDANALGAHSGSILRLTTQRGCLEVVAEVSTTMQPGHISLPNGMGLTPSNGEDGQGGSAPNELTSSDARDPYAGTPWHKNVPARLELI